MAVVKALVVASTGRSFAEKASTDTLDGAVAYNAAQTLTAAQQSQARTNIGASGHARFTGTITVPTLSVLSTASVTVASLAPATTGDSLAVNELVTLHFPVGSSLGSGQVQSYEPQVTATNNVVVKIVAFAAVTLGSPVPVTILVHR